MRTLTIALRNVFRNKRRTLMAMSSIVVGVVALTLISGFVATVRHALQTEVVRNEGHVQIMAANYLDLGAAYPGRFAVTDWRAMARALREDPELGANIRVVAPRLQVAGVIGNAETGAARSFVGVGFDPDLHRRMQGWDGFRLGLDEEHLPLDAARPELIVIGVGLARQLQLCGALALADCVDYDVFFEPDGPQDEAIAALSEMAVGDQSSFAARHPGLPVVDLLVASPQGLANARSVWVSDALTLARRQMDNAFVAMDLSTAQSLAFDGEDRVSHLMVQFHSDAYAARGLERIRALLADSPQALDILPLEEFNDTFSRVVAMFTIMQVFVGVVVCLIILFMVANTMAIIVMERVNEIGTLRAIGETRAGIRNLFLSEGALLGALSATLGVAVSGIVVLILNNSGLGFTTPNSTTPIPVRILFVEVPLMVLAIWATITLAAALSSLLPAFRAARYRIVDALRFA